MSSLVISKIQKNVKNFRKQAQENMLLTAIAMRQGATYKEVCVQARNDMDTAEWDAVKSAVLKPLRAGKKLYEARVDLFDTLVGDIDDSDILNATIKDILFCLNHNGDPVTVAGWLNYNTTTTPATTTPATTTPATTTPATTTPATTTPGEIDSVSDRFNDELIQLIEKYADLKKSEILEIMENAVEFFKLRTLKKVA